jgi:hypothetical protein
VDSFTNIMNIASGEKDCMLTMRENVITSLVNSLQDRFCDALTGVIGAIVAFLQICRFYNVAFFRKYFRYIYDIFKFSFAIMLSVN